MVSWHRSRPLEVDISDDASLDWSPSELAAEIDDDVERRSMAESVGVPVPPKVDDPGPTSDADAAGARWRCVNCPSSEWHRSDGRYVCVRCGCNEFYNLDEPTKLETATGTWVYVPHSPNSASGSLDDGSIRDDCSPYGSPGKTGKGKTKPSSGPPSDSFVGGSERAESEAPTYDPSVDPDGSQLGRRRRRRRRGGIADADALQRPHLPDQANLGDAPPDLPVHHAVEPQPAGQLELLNMMRQLLDERRGRGHGSDASWTSAKGPSPGVKWRGGTAPAPPKWQYQNTDLRAFAKFEGKVRTWVLQAKSYLSPSEMALNLFVSLQGEAEAEAEHLDLEKVNHRDGIEYILNELRGPLQQKELFQKRKLLADYEGVRRYANETVRQFCNRCRRIERDLNTAGIHTGAMYDDESRGNRILERCSLSPDLQRLVLIGAGNNLSHDKIIESLCMQFPDFKPTPVLWQSGGGGPRHQGSTSSAASSSGTSSTSYRSSSGSFRSSSTHSGKGKPGKGYSSKPNAFGKGPPRSVFQTEQVEPESADHEQEEEPDENDEFQDAAEGEDGELEAIPEGEDEVEDEETPNCDTPSTLAELAQVLTVTSRKLQASVLGRKFAGRKSIDERKRTSTCSACGQMGHWAGDDGCGASGWAQTQKGVGKVGRPAGAPKGNNFSNNPKGGNPKGVKKAYVVGIQNEQQADDHDNTTNYFAFTAVQLIGPEAVTSYVTETIDLAGCMVLDTACQRSCCGSRWINVHAKILAQYGLFVKTIDSVDQFQFGSGDPMSSTQRAYFPIEMDGQESKGVLFGASVLDTNIPFLASRTLLERLGCIIDMFNKIITFSNLGVVLPLTHKHGHWVVNITGFSDDIAQHRCWKQLSSERIWHDPDPELICAPGVLNKGSIRDLPPQSLIPSNASCGTTGMASALGVRVLPPDLAGAPCLQGDERAGQVWFEIPVMDDLDRTHPRVGTPEEGDAGHHAESQPEDLHASGVPTLREQERIVQQVQKVSAEVQMGPRSRRMGSSRRSAATSFYALATALILQHPDHRDGHDFVQAQGQEQACNYFQIPSETFGTFSTASGDRFGRRGRDVGSGGLSTGLGQPGCLRGLGCEHDPARPGMKDEWTYDKKTVTRIHNIPRFDLFNESEFYKCDACPIHRGNFGLWTGKTVFKIKPQPGRTVLSNEARKHLRFSVRKSAQILHVEHQVMMLGTTSSSPLTFLKSRPRIDLLETFAGKAALSQRAPRFGLNALQPIDYNTGYDLERPQHQQHVDYLLDRYKPLVLVQGIDCRDWCLLQDNTNYVRRKILLLMRRAKARRLLRRVVLWCRKQVTESRFFLVENPVTSRLWLEPLIKQLLRLPGVYTVVCNSGIFRCLWRNQLQRPRRDDPKGFQVHGHLSTHS